MKLTIIVNKYTSSLSAIIGGVGRGHKNGGEILSHQHDT